MTRPGFGPAAVPRRLRDVGPGHAGEATTVSQTSECVNAMGQSCGVLIARSNAQCFRDRVSLSIHNARDPLFIKPAHL